MNERFVAVLMHVLFVLFVLLIIMVFYVYTSNMTRFSWEAETAYTWPATLFTSAFLVEYVWRIASDFSVVFFSSIYLHDTTSSYMMLLDVTL